MCTLLFAMFIAFMAVISLAPDCFSAQYFVAQQSPEASDENPGTAVEPLRTIGAAISMVKEGDSIVIHEGVYRERVQLPEGKPHFPISIQAATDDGEYEEVIINGADIIDDWEPYQDRI